jgi:lysylphosphatidylglycerol synthetase-like protein (DUF2156 family)
MNLMPVAPQTPGAPGLDFEAWDTAKADSSDLRSRKMPGGKPRLSTGSFHGRALLSAFLLLLLLPVAQAQRPSWRQATDAELASLLPARAAVEREHIETEMRTASGIVNSRGRFIAGVVLLTAGYSADGKYSHYLIVQAPVRIGRIALKPGEYVFGWTRTQAGDALSVHFHEAATGALVGTTDAHRIAGSSRVESLHIWPPADKALIQIGRFAIPYELGEE